MASKPEIERKYLIAYPDVRALLAMEGAVCDELAQTYLLAPEGVTSRVRRRRHADGTSTYTHTVKRRRSMLVNDEAEREITETEYLTLLQSRNPALRTVEKRRITLPYGGLALEIDLYPFWERTAILEIELPSESTEAPLPPFLTVLREVTEDARYKNECLARNIPAEFPEE